MFKLSFIFVLFLMSASAFSKRVHFPFMGRNFTLVVPETASPTKRPVLVLLHGCKQTPDIILKGTGLEKMALQKNFLILAPEQSLIYNMDHCWNWFLSSQQERNSVSEMAQIMDALELVKHTYKVDGQKVFVAGMSAGGVMAHNLAACYPDVFKGVAIHSGLSYKIAESLNEAQTVLTIQDQKSPEYMGKSAAACAAHYGSHQLSRFLMIHGSLDPRVNAVHSEIISKTNQVWWDFEDDGRRNHSQEPAIKRSMLPSHPAYSVVKTEKTYKLRQMIEQKIIINGMVHAWGGGVPVTENFDPKAPSSSQFILNFFQL